MSEVRFGHGADRMEVILISLTKVLGWEFSETDSGESAGFSAGEVGGVVVRLVFPSYTGFIGC